MLHSWYRVKITEAEEEDTTGLEQSGGPQGSSESLLGLLLFLLFRWKTRVPESVCTQFL
jgi:hypothetical protein